MAITLLLHVGNNAVEVVLRTPLSLPLVAILAAAVFFLIEAQAERRTN